MKRIGAPMAGLLMAQVSSLPRQLLVLLRLVGCDEERLPIAH